MATNTTNQDNSGKGHSGKGHSGKSNISDKDNSGKENISELRDAIFTSSILNTETGLQNLAEVTIHPNFMMRNNFYIRKGVPESHRRVADNYMIIKKIFGSPVIQSNVTEEEKVLLAKYDFSPLAVTSGNQINEELGFLKKWSYSRNRDLQDAADSIIKIRAKYLSNIL